MRKIYLFFIIGLFLVSLISFVSANDIFYDNFESGSLSEWNLSHLGTAVDWTSSTTNPYQGTMHAQSRPTYTTEPASVMQKTISTSGYEDIVFKYYKKSIGLDIADEFQVEWYNGTGWTILEQTGSSSSNDAAYVSRSYSLPVVANNNPSFAIKFECTAGATSEYCRVDNVNVSGSLSSCVENLQNTSWTSWINMGSCMINDLQQQVKNRTQYDVNDCGYVNTTTYDYQNISCNYCSYSNINTTKSSWYDITSCNISDNKIQTRNWTEYDEDYSTCYAVTGLASDLFVNVTWFENQTASCDYCSYSLVNTSWSGWDNLTCFSSQMNQTRSLTQYDENYGVCYAVTGLASDYYANQTFFEYQFAGPSYVNTSWTSWNSGVCVENNLNKSRNLISYDIFGCAINITYFEYNLTFANLQNTTVTSWINDVCVGNDRNQTRNYTQYDVNNLGCYSNQTFIEYQTLTANLTYTDYTSWSNLTCVSNQMNQSRSRVQYDGNSLGCFSNLTEYYYQLIGPTYQNTSWAVWTNLSCLSNDKMNQSRNLTQFDIYSCALNNSIFEYRNTENCDFCTPSLTNTTKTAWQNQEVCRINDTQLQNRTWTEYDINNCGEIGNTTYWEYQEITCNYCSYSIANSSWSSWENISCLISNFMNQSRFRVEYDENYGICYAITNLSSDLWNSGDNNTYFEYQNIESCDYCTPSLLNTTKGEWYYTELCQIDNFRNRQRNWTQYDINNCGEIGNTTYFENEDVICDFCIPNLVNTIWSEWENLSCVDLKMNQSRFLIQYDINNCNEIENQTIYEYRNIFDCINDTTAPFINIFSPTNRSYNNERVLINFTADNYESLWYFNGTANRSYIGAESLYLEHGNYSFIFYANDSSGNLNFSSVDFIVNILEMNCDAGGPYQENAEVLVNGNATYNGNGIDSEEVNASVSKTNYSQSKMLNTYNGAFQTSFFNLSNGEYLLNTSISYNGINNSCLDNIKVGIPASLFLDKIVNIHTVSNNEIVYNISIIISNTGGKIINATLFDEYYGSYNLGEINSGVLFLSYLKNFTRQSTTTYYSLQGSRIIGISSYDNLEISANSSSINITIPAYSTAKQIIIVKNIIFNQETNRNVSYNVSSFLYNSGDENLEGIIFIDTDINNSAIVLNLQKEQEILFSNIFVIEKEATNLEHEFALGTATTEGLVFYSNRPKVNIPGYGGPADSVVYAPDSVNAGSSFGSIIGVINMNEDIGQDFVIKYWITNNDETINYSSGEKTIYVSALGRINTTTILVAPSISGTYKLRAIILWEGGSAIASDSFEVVSSIIVNPPSGGGGGVGEIFVPKKNETIINKTTPSEKEVEKEIGKEIICNSPYIRKGLECCLDENKNSICDSDEPAKEEPALNKTDRGRGITGLFVQDQDTGEISFNYGLFFILLIVLILIYLIWRYRRRILSLLRKKQRKFNGRIKSLIGLRVYTENGIEIGKVKDVILGENKIDSLKIKIIRKKFKIKGISLEYKHVRGVKDIVIIGEKILEEINSKNKQED